LPEEMKEKWARFFEKKVQNLEGNMGNTLNLFKQ
jgi:hypothetical protein